MEYSKVQMNPPDPGMEPEETVPSYASSTGRVEQNNPIME